MSKEATLPAPDLISNPAENYQANIIVCAVLTWAIAAAFVTLRLYTRRCLVHILGREDWVMVGSLFFSALSSAGAIEQASYGFGRHVLDIPEANFLPMSRSTWYSIVWYQLTLLLTKTSILLLYVRILTYQHARYVVYAILAVVVVTNIWAFVVVMTACVPLAAFWDYSLAADAQCHPRSFWWAATGMHMATDFLIFALPMPIIFHLNASIRQKVLLYGTFAFGFLVSLMSVVRLVYLTREYDHDDLTFDDTPLTYWTCIEVNTAIVCACVMTLKPLISRHLPSLVRSRVSAPSRTNGHALGGGLKPPTIGSRPVRSRGRDRSRRRRSWLVLPDRMNADAATMDAEEMEDEEHIELMMGAKKDMEAHLAHRLGLPVRPGSMLIRDPRSQTAASMDGPEVRPSSSR